MKRNLIITACMLVVTLLLGLSGFTLAQPDLGSTNNDKLIGLYITTEHLDLFDHDKFLNDNIKNVADGKMVSDEDTSKYQGRLYATLNDNNQYIFEGTDGIPYFYHTVSDEHGTYSTVGGDVKIADGHTSIAYTDDGIEVTLDGTIYAAPSKGIIVFYYNPVYQSEDGHIYVMTGNGASLDSDGSEGSAFSHKIDSTTTVTENESTETYSISVTVSVTLKHPPVSHSILQFSSEGIIQSNDTYLPGNLPETITPHQNCSYIIIESISNQNISRTLYQKDDNTIETFYLGDNSILIKQFTGLEWTD